MAGVGLAGSWGLGQLAPWCPRNEWVLVLLGTRQLWAERVREGEEAGGSCVGSSPQLCSVLVGQEGELDTHEPVSRGGGPFSYREGQVGWRALSPKASGHQERGGLCTAQGSDCWQSDRHSCLAPCLAPGTREAPAWGASLGPLLPRGSLGLLEAAAAASNSPP